MCLYIERWGYECFSLEREIDHIAIYIDRWIERIECIDPVNALQEANRKHK